MSRTLSSDLFKRLAATALTLSLTLETLAAPSTLILPRPTPATLSTEALNPVQVWWPHVERFLKNSYWHLGPRRQAQRLREGAERYRRVAEATHKNSSKEHLRRVDPDTRAFLPESVQRAVAHEQGVPHAAAHVYITDEDGRLLLLERPSDADISPDKFQTVSGHMDFDDATPKDAALREAAEETGIALDPDRLVQISDVNEILRHTVTHHAGRAKVNHEAQTVWWYRLTRAEKERMIARYNTGEAKSIAFVPLELFERQIVSDRQRPDEDRTFTHTLHDITGRHAALFFHLRFLAETAGDLFRQSFSGVRAAMALSPSRDANPVYLHAMSTYGYLYARRLLATTESGQPLRLGIARDPRPSGEQIRDALARGYQRAALEAGRTIEVVDLGILTTPIAESAVRTLQLDGTAIVTASHNPLKENGVKFTTGHRPVAGFPPPGALLPASAMDEHIQDFGRIRHSRTRFFALKQALGGDPTPDVTALSRPALARVIDGYVQEVREGLFPGTPLDEILQGYPTAVDVNGGAGSVKRDPLWKLGLIATVLAMIGMKVLELHTELGRPHHGIEPKGTALMLLQKVIDKRGIDFGVAYDFDADRGTLAPEMQEQDVAALNVAQRLAWMEAYANVPAGQEIVVVAHEATSERVEEIVALFNRGRAGRPIRVRRVETGEINVVTAMQQERAAGAFVPIGVEGANGGTVLGTGTCRDGVGTQILTALALRDPKIRAVWARRSGHPEVATQERLTLRDLAATVPSRFTPQLTKKGVPIKIQALKLGMEAAFEAEWTASPWLQDTYSGYAFEHYEGVDRRDHLFGEGMGGWRLVLTRKKPKTAGDPMREFLWLRPSRTEPLVRYSVDALTQDSQNRLMDLWNSLYDTAVAIQPVEEGRPNPGLLDRLVRVAGTRAERDASALLRKPLSLRAATVGTYRFVGRNGLNLDLLLRLPKAALPDPITTVIAHDSLLDHLAALLGYYSDASLQTDGENMKAYLTYSDQRKPVRMELLTYFEPLESHHYLFDLLRAHFTRADHQYLGRDAEYLELEYYLGDLAVWREMRDRFDRIPGTLQKTTPELEAFRTLRDDRLAALARTALGTPTPEILSQIHARRDLPLASLHGVQPNRRGSLLSDVGTAIVVLLVPLLSVALYGLPALEHPAAQLAGTFLAVLMVPRSLAARLAETAQASSRVQRFRRAA